MDLALSRPCCRCAAALETVSVREDLRKLGLRHGVTHQGKLLVTYEEKTYSFTSPAEVRVMINKIQKKREDNNTMD